MITLTEEHALERAARADAEIRRGHHRGPLHGVPDYTATVIERLDQAGVVGGACPGRSLVLRRFGVRDGG